MKNLYAGLGLIVWKAAAGGGIPYAKRKVEERG